MLRLAWAFVLGTSRGGIRQNRTRDVAVLGDVSHTSLMLGISSTGRHLFLKKNKTTVAVFGCLFCGICGVYLNERSFAAYDLIFNAQ